MDYCAKTGFDEKTVYISNWIISDCNCTEREKTMTHEDRVVSLLIEYKSNKTYILFKERAKKTLKHPHEINTPF